MLIKMVKRIKVNSRMDKFVKNQFQSKKFFSVLEEYVNNDDTY